MKRTQPLLIALSFLLLANVGNAQVTKVAENVSGWSTFILKNRIVFFDTKNKLWSLDANNTLQAYATDITNINYFTAIFHDKLYFYGSSSTGANVYETDGTDTGTHAVTNKIVNARNPAICNNLLFLEGDFGGGYQLWRTDGTDAGTRIVKNMQNGIPVLGGFFAAYNTLFFAADNGPGGIGLWKSDGTEGGTSFVKAIPPANAQSYNTYGFYLVDTVNNMLLFSMAGVFGGQNVWTSDGTTGGTVQLNNNVNSGVHLGGKLFYSAPSPTSDNYNALWVTDGTPTGTLLAEDSVNLQAGNSIVLNNRIVGTTFSTLDTSNGFSTKTIDSFAIFPLEFYNNSTISLFNKGQNVFTQNKLFFIGNDGVNGPQLWLTDGTPANTAMVKNIGGPGGNAFGLVTSSRMGSHITQFASYYYTRKGIYFAANDSIHGMELWQSDGTEGGTKLVADVNAGADNSYPEFIGTFNGHLYFTAFDKGYNDYPQSPVSLFVINADTSTLPVTVSDFSALPVKNDVKLNWVTTTEINTSHYNIQKSVDGLNFKNIGSVIAAGNSVVTKAYQFTDQNALFSDASVLYYRLQANDKDGKISYSRIISVTLKKTTDKLLVYPNPAKNAVQLLFYIPNADNKKSTIRIVNADGQLVLTKQFQGVPGSNRQVLNTANLAAGIYILQVVTGENIQSTKFVKY